MAAADAADRLTECFESFSSHALKREAQSCAAQAVRRPLVACNTLLAGPKKKRRRLTPHPRAGEAAVKAVGGAVQSLLDEPTPRLDNEEEETVEGEAVYSSSEGSDLESDDTDTD